MARTDSSFLKAQGELYTLKRYVHDAANAIQARRLSSASLEAINVLNFIIETMCEAHLEDGQLVVEVSFYRQGTLSGFALTIDGEIVFPFEDGDDLPSQGGS